MIVRVAEACEELRDAVLVLFDAGAGLRDLLVEHGLLHVERELLQVRSGQTPDAQVRRFLHSNQNQSAIVNPVQYIIQYSTHVLVRY